jgi:hypothetical protein
MTQSQGRSRLLPRSLEVDIRQRMTIAQSPRRTTFSAFGILATRRRSPRSERRAWLQRGLDRQRGGAPLISDGSSIWSLDGSEGVR